ncbi:hypothetical protein Tco_0030105 [Tanacetum coccineum]
MPRSSRSSKSHKHKSPAKEYSPPSDNEDVKLKDRVKDDVVTVRVSGSSDKRKHVLNGDDVVIDDGDDYSKRKDTSDRWNGGTDDKGLDLEVSKSSSRSVIEKDRGEKRKSERKDKEVKDKERRKTYSEKAVEGEGLSTKRGKEISG